VPDRPVARDFRKRLLAREHVLGTFIKIPTSHTIEIVGALGFDYVIIDAEHAPYDRAAIDLACLAARAANTAAIVRVQDESAATIMSALDCGAAGVMVPHCDSAEKARAVAAACRHRGGIRGFATTTRAGSWGAAAAEDHIADQDARTVCIAMIEDTAALERLPAITAVHGIDAFFIGRGDLGAALGPTGMKAATEKIAGAVRAADKPVVALVSGREDAVAMRDLGVSAFLHSNDQNLFKTAAAQALSDYGDPAAW
jgi:2-keto-3-deoxy-L-rhamnonate aldolase RhmA